MVKTIKHKKIGKRILALFLALMTVLSCFAMMPLSSYALDSSIEEWNGHHRFTVDGQDAFCINFGADSSGKFKNDAAAVTYWKGLGASKQNKIREIVSCAADKKYLNSSDDTTYFGIQRAIWAVVSSKSEMSEANGGLSDWFKSQTKAVYDALNNSCASYSNTAPKINTIYLNPESNAADAVYAGSGTDSKKVLSNWGISDKGGLNHVSKSGNTLTVRNKVYFSGTKKITLKSSYDYYAISDDCVGRFGNQEAIAIGSPSVLTKKVNVKCNPPGVDINLLGSINATKRDDSGNLLSGVQFDLYDINGYYDSDLTDANGNVSFLDLDYGTYWLYEITPDGYVPYNNGGSAVLVVNSETPITATNDGSGYWTNVIKRGDVAVHKNNEFGNALSGVQFALYNESTGYYLTTTTNGGGDCYFANVPLGWYQLVEYIPSGYVIPTGFTNYGDGTARKYVFVNWDGETSYAYKDYANNDGGVLVNWGNSATYTYETVTNQVQRGDLKVHKTEEIPTDTYKGGQYQDGNNFEFTITSKASDNVMGVDLKYVQKSGSDGFAYFCDIPAGTYTVKETNLDVKFVQPENQTVQIVWDGNTAYEVSGKSEFKNTKEYYGSNGSEKSLSFTNVLKKFNVHIEKEDPETKKRAQGDATLAGAVYELYKGNTLVGTYTTDAHGSFVTDYFVCDDDYFLKEKTPSNGYLLDKETHPIKEGPNKFTVEYNDTNKTVYEDVIKGQIQLFKYTDDDDKSDVNPVEPNAEFQIWLKSSGSYDNCYESERDYLVTDENGIATSKSLPYGTYVVHQTKGTEGYMLADDFEVFIDTNGKVYRYFHIENHVTELYLKVVKKDAETGKVIPYNNAQGAMFQILDKDGKVMKFKYTYPEVTTIDTFTINSKGYLMLPEKLKYGKYYLVEVQSPYGYYNKNYDVNDPKITAVTDESGNTTYKYDFNDVYKIPFNISENDAQIDKIETGSDVESEIKYVTVDVYNQNQMGVINVTKQGEVFSSVTKLGDTYTPVYEVKGLAGAVYKITAAEDIITPDGTVRYHKGDVVDTITTNSSGVAASKQLYLGKYTITETKAPHGYVNNGEAQAVKLTYQGQQYDLIDTSATFSNERQKCTIEGTKSVEIDKLYDIGNNGEIENIKFGLFASQEMKAADGKVIPKDGLIEIVYVTSEGKIEFSADLPVDYKYYVKEISTDEHYVLDDTKYEIDFKYQGEKVSTVDLKINNGKTINNSIIRGDIVGHKVDESGKNLYGAKFGLFKADETEYTEKNAYLVSVSAKDGHFEFKDVPYGNYQIKELSAPKNYIYSEEPINVSIVENNQEINLGDIENVLAKGTIEIEKTGEIFSSVVENEDGTFTPVYKTGKLEGVTFDVIAAEDIYSYFGEKLVSKGDVVDTVATDENGTAKTTELYFGKYYVVEKETLDGFVLDDTKHKVDLHYVDNNTPIVVETLSLENARQKAEISLNKEMEKDSIFNLGNNNEIANVVFGLFAGEDLTATDGSVIEKDSILETATTDENGHLVFKTDIPYGYKYYVKEMSTDKHYILSDKKYEFTNEYQGQDIDTVHIVLNNGEPIINEFIYGTIKGLKVDRETEKTIEGALFGLFKADETEFTKDNAIFTALSDKNGIFTFENIPYGNWIVKELQPAENYLPSDDIHYITVSENEQIIEIKVENDKIPELKTTATVDGEKEAIAKGEIAIDDVVEYKHLIPGKKYKIVGTLMDKSTGKPFEINGKPVTSEVIFTPEKSNGKVTVSFTFDASVITESAEVVVFENLYCEDNEVAVHADINDEGQTVKLNLPVTEESKTPKTGSIMLVVLTCSALGSGTLLLTANKKRRKTVK